MGQIDETKIDRMDVRLRIAQHEEARGVIEAELVGAQAPFRERIAAIEKEMEAATVEITARLEAHDETPGIYREVLETDYADAPVRCCVSNLVLLEGDELVEDCFGNKALRAAVPGWPEPPEPPANDCRDEDDEDEEQETT